MRYYVMGAEKQQGSSKIDVVTSGVGSADCVVDPVSETQKSVEHEGAVSSRGSSVWSLLGYLNPYAASGSVDAVRAKQHDDRSPLTSNTDGAGSVNFISDADSTDPGLTVGSHPTSQTLEELGSDLTREDSWELLELADVFEDKSSDNDCASAAPTSHQASKCGWEDAGENIRVLRGVTYGEVHWKQALDVYVPLEADAGPVPVVVHIHGGGWKRGDRAASFYGSPSVCLAAARSGFVAVAPSYRLGKYPDFVNDAAAALQWVHRHIADYGGDVNAIFLSGHSAGSHIASLMLIRHNRFLDHLDVPMNLIKGLILISGVYNLFNPIKEVALTYRNNVFMLAYVLPSFGSDEAIRREASPLLLLAPETNTTTEGFYRSTLRSLLGLPVPYTTSGRANGDAFHEDNLRLPPVLIFNAEYDLGLEADGERMAAALRKFSPDVHYVKVKGCNHASICWTAQTHETIRRFVELRCSKEVTALPSDLSSLPNRSVGPEVVGAKKTRHSSPLLHWKRGDSSLELSHRGKNRSITL